MTCSLFGQGNPFLSGGGEGSSPPVQSEYSFWQWLSDKSAGSQRQMQRVIADGLDDMEAGSLSEGLFVLLGASFLYGLVHAIGPGHRKGVLLAFFLGEGHAPIKGILAGFLLAGVHALSAILLVGGLFYLTTRPVFTSVNNAEGILMITTWGIILLMGIWMAVSGFRQSRHPDETGSRKRFGALILSGTVPCPGASAIMILAVSRNAFFLGTASVAAMSLGMGVLLASVGILAVLFRRRMKKMLKSSTDGSGFEKALHILSGAFMALFALFMLMGWL